MLANFFSLNSSTPINHDILTQVEFETMLSHSSGIKNCIYKPNELKSPGSFHPKIKIKGVLFENFSFSRTLIEDIMFIDCRFKDCLFLGTQIKDCEFQNCLFIEVNTHKIIIEKTYIDPSAFISSIKGYDKANIAVHLFQQLLRNSQEQGQSSFVRVAEYNFKKWHNRLTFVKFWKRKPYGISFWIFIKTYLPSFIFRWTFGYGLRFRNFMATFIIIFTVFFTINFYKWKSYSLASKDMSIYDFKADSVNFKSNFFYTLDVTTKLVDSQFQPKSSEGMFWLSFQSICAFFLLSALVTLIANRFVK